MLGNYEQIAAPDQVEPITGWRTWKVTRSYGKVLLYSPQQKTIWPPRQNFQAICYHSDNDRLHCHCGVNTYSIEEDLLNEWGVDDDSVWGEVKLWGEVHKYNKGYRGEYAYPKKLYAGKNVSEKVRQEIAELYGVEVVQGAARKQAKVKPAGTYSFVAKNKLAIGFLLMSLLYYLGIGVFCYFWQESVFSVWGQNTLPQAKLGIFSTLLIAMLPMSLVLLCIAIAAILFIFNVKNFASTMLPLLSVFKVFPFVVFMSLFFAMFGSAAGHPKTLGHAHERTYKATVASVALLAQEKNYTIKQGSKIQILHLEDEGKLCLNDTYGPSCSAMSLKEKAGIIKLTYGLNLDQKKCQILEAKDMSKAFGKELQKSIYTKASYKSWQDHPVKVCRTKGNSISVTKL